MNAANLLLALTWSSAVPAQLGGMPYVGPGRDIIVATVKSYSLKTGIADLVVHGVLRGDPRLDRRKALWQGPIDLSEGKLQLPVMPDPVPAAAGKTYILSGDVQRHGKKLVFVLSPYWRYKYSPENLKEVRNYLIRENVGYFVYELRSLASATMLGVKRSFWRHSTNALIPRYAAEADFIVVGNITSEGFNGSAAVACDIHVSRVLKGKWRTTGHNNNAAVAVPASVHQLMNRDTPYLFFLSERGMMLGVGGGSYPILGGGRAVTIADTAALEATQKALAAQPPTPARPLLLLEIQVGNYDNWNHFCRTREQLAASFDKAADERATVLRSNQFSIDVTRVTNRDQAFIAKHMRALVPGAHIYLGVRLDETADKPSSVKLTALNLATAQGDVILSRAWQFKDQADMDAKIAEVMRKLIAPAPK
jgi:hypothetical protein